MASLEWRGRSAVLAFYSASQRPKRTKVTLGVVSAPEAEQMKLKLEAAYYSGAYDPWAEKRRLQPTAHDCPHWPSSTAPTSDANPACLEELVETFLESKRKLAPKTLRGYRSVLGLLLQHTGHRASVSALTATKIERFIESRELSATSENTYRTHVRVFTRWLVERGLLEDDPIKDVKVRRAPKVFVRYFTRAEIDRLCETIATRDPHSFNGNPTWLIPIVRFAAEMGLRRSEITNLRWSDVDGDHIQFFRPKTQAEHRLPLSPVAAEVLRGLDRSSEFVFTTSSGKKVGDDFLTKSFARYAHRAGLSDRRFHTLRHTCASWLVMAGVPIVVVKEFMGHTVIGTTMRYAHLLEECYSAFDVFILPIATIPERTATTKYIAPFSSEVKYQKTNRRLMAANEAQSAHSGRFAKIFFPHMANGRTATMRIIGSSSDIAILFVLFRVLHRRDQPSRLHKTRIDTHRPRSHR